MTYRNIDRQRLGYLLSLGTDDSELRQFFSDCRLQLIQNGAKVQNPPQGPRARIRTLSTELPPATDEIVGSWFAKHLAMVDPQDAESVVREYRLYEEYDETLPEADARRLSRSCLVHLFTKDPPAALVEFLKTPIARGGAGQDGPTALEPTADPSAVLDTEAISKVLVAVLEGQDVDHLLEGFPPDLATFVAAIQAAMQGKPKEARGAAESLPEGSPVRTRIDRFLDVREEAGTVSRDSPPRGLRLPEPAVFDSSFDCERDEVLACCTKADQWTFLRPIAVVRGDGMHLLTDDARRQAFPDSGDVIAFAGTARPQQPRRGELGIWRVAEHETDGATRFHLASEKRPVYEVRHVPFPSTDHDSVREFLKEQAETRQGLQPLQPLLFRLDDGLLVGADPKRPDLSKDETFENGLHSWSSLGGVRWEGRVFVLGPLPKAQGAYECGSLASTVRRLLKPHLGGGALGGLTKSQVSALAQAVGSSQTTLDAARVSRVRSELERLSQQHEVIEVLVSDLMGHPTVGKRIEELVDQESTRRLSEKNAVQVEIAQLQKERRDWDERISKLKGDLRSLSDQTSKVVKTAFDKARADGVAALGEVAVFQAFAHSPKSAHVGEPPRGPSQTPVRMASRTLAPRGQDVAAILKSFGAGPRVAAALAATGRVAHKAGLMVCVRGTAARVIVERWASAIAHAGVLIDSMVGLIDDSFVREVLAGATQPDVWAILDANVSALDVYARPLSDIVLARLVAAEGGPAPSILLALADGVASLPLPTTFERLSVVLDLDAPYVFQGAADIDNAEHELLDSEEGTLSSRLWRPAADRLRSEIRQLDVDSRGLVVSILARK